MAAVPVIRPRAVTRGVRAARLARGIYPSQDYSLMGLGSFFAMLLSFTGAAVVILWTIALAATYARRAAAKTPIPGQLSAEELEAIRARLAELEQRDVRVEEIEERL